MKMHFRLSVLLLALQLFFIPAFATWSIIIVDPVTKEIGIVGASCTSSVYGIGAIIPGKGAVVVQAMSNKLALFKGLEMLKEQRPPQAIIDSLRNEMFDPEHQQYGVVCLYQPNDVKVYSGNDIPDFNGALTGNGISVQGNTLADATEIQKIMVAVKKAQKESLPLGDQLMAALEAGSEAGGDKRCGKRKASSAFITIAKATDDVKKPSTNIIVSNLPPDGPNAVDVLRKKYNEATGKK